MPDARRAVRLVLPFIVGVALVATTASAQDPGVQVVGGTTAEPGEYPWQIALYKKQGPSFGFICGGTLIAAQRVLTAAHCTSGNASSMLVKVGTQFLNSGGTVIGVSGYADHPSYSSSTSQNDVAVLQLASSGTAGGGQVLQLIGQEGSADDGLWAAGDMLAISGWGSMSEGGGVTNQLREAYVPRVADATCGQGDYYGSEFDPATMVCAGFDAGGVDTCQGDSGGPLAASTQTPPPASENDPSQWRLVGVTSWGLGCARAKKPGVYSRVAAPGIRNWIVGTPSQFQLGVSTAGNGAGTVTSSPAGINCGADCTQNYDDGTPVTLNADPATGSTFTGWSGDCSGTGACQLTMNQQHNVTATFTDPTPPPPTHTLNVFKSGNGTGTVTSSPAGINCGADCTQSYNEGTPVTLTADPGGGSTFTGWSDACSGTGTCQVTMNQAQDVTATFSAAPPSPTHTLTVSRSGTGTGTVTSNPAGINCGSDCTQSYNEGTSVTLTPAAAAGSAFAGWSGACSGTGACQVAMTQARSATATFNAQEASPPPDVEPAPTNPTSPFSPSLDDPLEELDETAPLAAIASQRLRMSRRGYVRVRIDCDEETDDCLGVVRIRLRLPTAGASALSTVGRASFKVSAGESKRVRLRLRRRARRLVRQEESVRARAVAVVEDPAGNERTLRKKLTLRAP